MAVANGLRRRQESTEKIIDLFKEGKDKKYIANLLKVELGYVVSVYNKNKQVIIDARNAKQVSVETVKKEISTPAKVELKPAVEEEKVEEKAEEKKSSSHRSKLTEEQKMNIGILLETTDKLMSEIADEFGISNQRVSQIGKELGVVRKNKSRKFRQNKVKAIDRKQEKEERKIIDKEIRDVIHKEDLHSTAKPKTNVVAEAHEEKKITKRIEVINNSNILNPNECSLVDYLYSRNFKFDENGIPDKDMILYPSGLQQANDEFKKACMRHHINLTIMYYNESDNAYVPNVFFDQFPTKNGLILDPYFERILNLYTFDCDIDILQKEDHLCVIKFADFRDGKMKDLVGFICKDFDDINVSYLYACTCKYIMERTTEKNAVYAVPMIKDKGVWISNDLLYSKSFNFPNSNSNKQ